MAQNEATNTGDFSGFIRPEAALYGTTPSVLTSIQLPPPRAWP